MPTDTPGSPLANSKAELLLQALSGGALEAQCLKCEAIEWVIPLGEPLDDIFIANYFCDECDTAS